MTEGIIQEIIKIGNINIPIIKEDDKFWYPYKFIFKKVLFKNINSRDKDKINLGDNYKTFNIDYGFNTGGVQLVGCINKEGLNILIKNFKIGGYNLEQRQGYNNLIRYFNFDYPLLPEYIIQDINLDKENYKEIIKNYDIYLQDCIIKVLQENKNITLRYCSHCGKLFPFHKMFYNEDQCNNTLMHKCKICQGKSIVLDNESNRAYNHNKNALNKDNNYRNYKEHNTIEIYKEWYYEVKNVNRNISLPKIINNKEDILKIIKYLYDMGYINKMNLTSTLLQDTYKFAYIGNANFCSMKEVYIYLFGDNYWKYPWHYKNLKLPILTYKQGILIFNNYLKEKNIIIDNIFEFDYSKMLKEARLTQFLDNILEFKLEYNNRNYPAYKFKSSGRNYYKIKENRNFDLKYLIEKDLNIEINKIPLYLTKATLQKRALSLYRILHSKYYYKNLFEWIDEIYPNKFIENDFVINPYRDEFDSNEEIHINKILHDNFNNNIIYNQRNTDRTIKINGMIPDWLLFTDNNCWLIEYFGLYVNNKFQNKMLEEYRIKTDKKIDKYKKIKGYKSLFLFPEDLDDDFKKLKNKLKEIS